MKLKPRLSENSLTQGVSNPNTKLLLRRQSFQSSISKGERIDKIEFVLDPNNKITINGSGRR